MRIARRAACAVVVRCYGMRRLVLTLALAAVGTAPAFAQTPRTLPPFVIDVRGIFAKLGQDPTTAADLQIGPGQLPPHGLGGVVGAHLYPLRRGSFAIGIGGEAVLARGRSQIVLADGSAGPRVERRLQGVSAQISLNFGHRMGWSYLSAGLGPLRFESFTGGQAPAVAPPFAMTQNFGAGARWFNYAHLAFCFDLRFYLTRPQMSSATTPGRERQRVTVLSAGIAIK
jgi:hypothetical protein